jgi:hypothetical protein
MAAFKMIKQGDYYKAKTALFIGRCKPKQDDIFWITTPSYSNDEFVTIARKGKTGASGYRVPVQQFLEFFDKV